MSIATALKKVIAPPEDDEIGRIDSQLNDVRTRLSALAETEAQGQTALDALQEEWRAALNLGHATDEAESKILGARENLRRLAARRVELEKLLDAKAAALKAKRKAVRVARLQAALASTTDEVKEADEVFTTAALSLSGAMERREKLTFSANQIADRLRRLGVPTEQRNFPLPFLDAALKAKDARARRDVPFGQMAFRFEDISIPIVNHDLRVPALELDDAAEATA